MFYASTHARATRYKQIIERIRQRKHFFASKVINDAFKKELAQLRFRITELPASKVERIAHEYFSSQDYQNIWLDVWKRIRLEVGSAVWEFNTQTAEKKSLLPTLPALPALPALPSLETNQTKSMAALANYPTAWQNIVFRNVAEKGGTIGHPGQ